MDICCLCLPNIQAPLPLITPALFFLGKCPIPQSPAGEPQSVDSGRVDASVRSREWSHKPGLTNHSRLLSWQP